MEKNFRNWLLEEEAGQGMVEYALILAFIALAAILGVTQVGDKLVDFFNKANDVFPNV